MVGKTTEKRQLDFQEVISWENLVIGFWETRYNHLPCILTDTDVSSRSTVRLS
jgi:hypothetical protein